MGGHAFGFLWILILLSQNNQSEGWFFSSKDDSTEDRQRTETNQIPKDLVAEFSMEPLNSQKGMKLVENARRMAVSSNSCWQNAYKNLFAGCSEILAGEETRSRFAWHLSDCFQKDSGRTDFPYCDVKSPMLNCLKKLNEDARKVYLEFFLETNSICHQLQADAFKRQMERLVNELKKTAENAEIKIESIEERAEQLLQSSNQIHDSLALVDLHTGQVAQTLKNVGDHVNSVLTNSEAVYEQFVGIAASQSELREGQAKMNETLEHGMAMLHDSYNNLGAEISNLGDKAVEIDNQISKVGDAMSSKMNTLQSKAEDIGNITEISLDKQSELLAGQSAAVEGLQALNKIMSQALEESKSTMQQLAEFGHRQQEELLHRQKQLEQAHDHLVENSKTILAAQSLFIGDNITVRMVTGDNINSAKAIAKECGILTEGGLAIEGPEFRTKTPDELKAIIPRIQVMARSLPLDKHMLVMNLRNIHKEVVAVTGDGTNDAPALHEADIGFAMGIAGTELLSCFCHQGSLYVG